MKRIAALLVAFALAGTAQASDHYAIIRNSDNENRPVATVDIAAIEETGMRIVVLGNPSGSTTVNVGPTERYYFASADLVPLGGGLEPGEAKLVRCLSDQPVSTVVTLRGDQGEAPVPPAETSLGVRFIVPLGDLGKGVTLLLGNPAALDIQVTIEAGFAVLQTVTVPALGVLDVPLSAANQRHVVDSVGPAGDQPRFIAALVYSEKGRSSRMVMLTPS